MQKSLILTLIPVALIGCGAGGDSTTLPGQNYFSASYSSYYNIESSASSSQLYLNIVSQGQQYTMNAPLTPTIQTATESQYTFNQNGATGTITIKDNNLGISYNSSSSTWTDFATQNIGNSLPNGTYNLICDQTNLSACQLTVSNNNISITEFSVTGQTTQLCSNSSAQKAPANLINTNLYEFNCGVNGGSRTGVWYVMPMTISNTTALLISEYNPTSNDNDDTTDEIAFPVKSINPIGAYTYVYNGGSVSSGVGTSTAQFSVAGLVNQTVGLCSGSACALIQNQYYNNQPQTGFTWYNVNGQSNYNLVGNDAMKIYQDGFEGFYF